jgi:uncharacterized SAM-binding protein YcdF (DUF218 family)
VWKVARVAFVVLLAWSLLAWVAARWLIVSVELPQADAIVVLSGSAAYVERTQRAAAAYRAGRAPRIVLTDDGQRGGWSSAEQRNPLFVERAVEELRRNGVPAASIEVAPGLALGTHEEALLLRGYAEARGLRSLIFVTSGYHSRRAWWTLRRVFAGRDIQLGVDAVAPGAQTPAPGSWWLTTRGWRQVAGEYVKLAYYQTHY